MFDIVSTYGNLQTRLFSSGRQKTRFNEAIQTECTSFFSVRSLLVFQSKFDENLDPRGSTTSTLVIPNFYPPLTHLSSPHSFLQLLNQSPALAMAGAPMNSQPMKPDAVGEFLLVMI